jgi:hypothetical protein
MKLTFTMLGTKVAPLHLAAMSNTWISCNKPERATSFELLGAAV